MILRPFFSFYGGKWRVAKHYPKPGMRIVEPFAGSAGYSLRYPDRDVLLIDKDPAIVATWRYLLAVTPSEVRALPDIQPGQDVASLNATEDARLLIGWWCNRGGTTPKRTFSSWGRQPKYARQFWGDYARQRIAAQVEAIRHWRVMEGDYRDAPAVDATWFIDPPYALAGKHYKCGSKSIDYADLADFCQSRLGTAIVCENTGADWLPFQHFRDSKANESKHGGKVSREAIWISP